MTYNDYIKDSLELHLFFDRIMKEHSFFIEADFLEKNDELKKQLINFNKVLQIFNIYS